MCHSVGEEYHNFNWLGWLVQKLVFINYLTDSFLTYSLGLSCETVCHSVGGQAGARGIPAISSGCGTASMNDKTHYPTFTRSTGEFIAKYHFIEEVMKQWVP